MARANSSKERQPGVPEVEFGLQKSDFVQSLERGLRVIKAFDVDHQELALSDVARMTGLTRAAARRFLLTLTAIGYVRHEDGLFSLRPRVLELGSAYVSSFGLSEVAHSHIKALVAEVDESVAISVLDDMDIVHILSERPRRIMGIMALVGTRLPAHWTSMGRVLLANLPPEKLEARIRRMEFTQVTPTTVMDVKSLREILDTVRGQGWALVDQEVEIGLRAIAVPLRDTSGRAIAAMNVAALTSRTTTSALTRRFLPALQATAKAIEDDLRHLERGRVDLRLGEAV